MPSNAKAAARLWSAERTALAVEVLRRTGHLRLRAHGESMLPALWPGDVVEIVSCSLQDAQPGDIVLAEREGQFFLHRLVDIAGDGFLLHGDSMPGPDLLFSREALLGRLVGRVHESTGFSTAALRPGLVAKCSRALGMFLCHSNLARRLALELHSRRKASVREFQNFETGVDVSTSKSRA